MCQLKPTFGLKGTRISSILRAGLNRFRCCRRYNLVIKALLLSIQCSYVVHSDMQLNNKARKHCCFTTVTMFRRTRWYVALVQCLSCLCTFESFASKQYVKVSPHLISRSDLFRKTWCRRIINLRFLKTLPYWVWGNFHQKRRQDRFNLGKKKKKHQIYTRGKEGPLGLKNSHCRTGLWGGEILWKYLWIHEDRRQKNVIQLKLS